MTTQIEDLQELEATEADAVEPAGCCALASFATCPTRTFNSL